MRTRADYYSLRACPSCNRIYEAGLRTETDQPCPDCLKGEKRQHGAYVPKPPGRKAAQFVMTADPSGDFRTEMAVFDLLEFALGLDAGNWSDGTTFDCQGTIYTVTGTHYATANGKTYCYQNFGLVDIEELCEPKAHGRPRKHPGPASPDSASVSA